MKALSALEAGTITNLHFAGDISDLAGEEEDLAKLVECLDKASTAYGMEIRSLRQSQASNTWAQL